MKTILIVEDNSRSREMLIKLIENIRDDVIIKEASNQDEASALVMKHNIDLFILDIMLNSNNPSDVSGMQFAEYIRSFPKYKYIPIIFITALEDPALHAYSELHCYYYVEKPYDADKVSAAISDALDMPQLDDAPHNIYFRCDGVLYKKEVSDIIYIENARSGQTVYCTNGNLKLPYKPIKKILEELGSDKFIQCSRFHIVNEEHIDKIDTVNRYIRLKDTNEQIEFGNTFKKKFLSGVLDGAKLIK
ncbi:MAG: response regulator transcription factor [Lachnospiraceae bacterium]|nr:response regulator transcription factor [Lachnospiraceae bacterium]